ncbi:MAG: hypothetical protein OXQ90_02205, partial [Gammaproteobacteria bacterium]|nr:hypothetical protein [Gammaproteobacteria bacterium]
MGHPPGPSTGSRRTTDLEEYNLAELADRMQAVRSMSLMELAARLGSTEGYESLSTAAGTPWVAVRLDGEPSPSFHAQPNCPVVGIC